FSDVAHRHTLFGYRVIPGSWLEFLESQPVQTRGINHMDCCPAILPFPHIRGHALLASYRNEVTDKPLLERILNLRKPYSCRPYASFHERLSRCLRSARIAGRRRPRIIFFCCRPTLIQSSQPGRDKQGPLRALQHRADRLDGMLVQLRVLHKLRKVVVKSHMNDRVCSVCATAKAFQILKTAPL